MRRIENARSVRLYETMKMETPLIAPVDGVVSAVEVSPNAQVAGGAPLVRLRSRRRVLVPPTEAGA